MKKIVISAALILLSFSFFADLPFNSQAQIIARSKPLIIAHRGGARESTENTIEAFQRAARIGADGIETDLRLTRDGVVVIYHDEIFGRVEGLPKPQQTRPVADMTYPELRASPLTPVGDDAGNRHVPTLEDVLAKIKTGLLNIELKRGANFDKLVDKTIEILRATPARDRVVLEPPDLRTAEKLRKALGADLKLHINPAYDTTVSFQESLEKVLKFKPHSISVNFRKVSLEVIEKAHQSGVEVWAWTLDSPEIAGALWTLKVDAIKTDRPTALLDAFRRAR
ncbi:MAG: glycerophosphodiester phosphodiesterase [Acidobacteriota bacterium]